jgi:hypothetical protein
MIDDEVHDELHTTLLDFLDKIVNIGQSTIARIDVFVVCDVIPGVSV